MKLDNRDQEFTNRRQEIEYCALLGYRLLDKEVSSSEDTITMFTAHTDPKFLLASVYPSWRKGREMPPKTLYYHSYSNHYMNSATLQEKESKFFSKICDLSGKYTDQEIFPALNLLKNAMKDYYNELRVEAKESKSDKLIYTQNSFIVRANALKYALRTFDIAYNTNIGNQIINNAEDELDYLASNNIFDKYYKSISTLGTATKNKNEGVKLLEKTLENFAETNKSNYATEIFAQNLRSFMEDNLLNHKDAVINEYIAPEPVI